MILKNVAEIIIVILIIAGMTLFFGYLWSSSEDGAYLRQPIENACPGVPELTYWNTTFFEETKVHECSFLGYCSDTRIDWHKTAEKMKGRCKELQKAKRVSENG
jgi:hypothetical protein